jgi:hypothetical protein
MSRFDPDLQAVVVIKKKAEAAAKTEASPFNADELVGAYMRIRTEAKVLNERAFGGDDAKFDEEFPPLEEQRSAPGSVSGSGARRAYGRSQGALVLLGQLAAWAAGYQETMEISARIKADAEARVKSEAESEKPRWGKNRAGFEPPDPS